ncbi:MAG: alpha/beta fold hydrolase [Bdellovibrionales bacterium]
MHFQRWLPDTAQFTGTVLCVHGLTRNSYDFERLAAVLTAAGYQVIAPDIVGRGKSDRLTEPALYNYATYAADLMALIEREKLRDIAWVGTSMGGVLGMMIAAKHPRLISRLVLNDVGTFIPKASLERIVAYADKPPPVFATLEDAEAHCRKAYAAFGIARDEDWKYFTRISLQEIPGGYSLAYDPSIITALAASPLTDVNLLPLWSAQPMPVLLLRGAESDLLPHDIAVAMALRPSTQLVEFRGCGHAPSLTVAERIPVVAGFISGTPAEPPAVIDILKGYGRLARAGWKALIQARRTR